MVRVGEYCDLTCIHIICFQNQVSMSISPNKGDAIEFAVKIITNIDTSPRDVGNRLRDLMQCVKPRQ